MCSLPKYVRTSYPYALRAPRGQLGACMTYSANTKGSTDSLHLRAVRETFNPKQACLMLTKTAQGADVSALVRNEWRWQWAEWRACSWWWPDVFLFVSLKPFERLLLPALCFALCWTLRQQRSKMDRLSTAYLFQCKTMTYICLTCHEALWLPAAHCMSYTAFLFRSKLHFFTLQTLFSLTKLILPSNT